MVSKRVRTRLVMHEAILALIDRRRAEIGDPNVGASAEKRVLDIELADLERTTVVQERMESTVTPNIDQKQVDEPSRG